MGIVYNILDNSCAFVLLKTSVNKSTENMYELYFFTTHFSFLDTNAKAFNFFKYYIIDTPLHFQCHWFINIFFANYEINCLKKLLNRVDKVIPG